MTPTRSISLAPMTREAVSAVIPLAIRNLRRSVLDCTSLLLSGQRYCWAEASNADADSIASDYRLAGLESERGSLAGLHKLGCGCLLLGVFFTVGNTQIVAEPHMIFAEAHLRVFGADVLSRAGTKPEFSGPASL